MTHLFNNPATFTEDMLVGFVAANSQYVTAVPGGVVRTNEPTSPKVAVVVGGGSGHYPAFCGVVGPGFADGAVVGNIFTSPSTDDAYHVAKAAHSGAGVLFMTGNYAGDVMNFDLAQARLSAEGITTRNVYVTDDVASAPADQIAMRRGIAGDFVVFKVASAAAEAGCDLAEVERVARIANDRTRTMGIGLDGCTLPGATDALFHVPAGSMGVGLGIHGEPGIAELPLPSASDVAKLLVERVLAEAPADDSKQIAVILNGLGATKYEELFVVYGTVAQILTERGYTIVEPEVGELVTSLDMAGISLTVSYLDDELGRFWQAPADTPAYRKGAAVSTAIGGRRRVTASPQAPAAQLTEGSPAAYAAACIAERALAAMATVLHEQADYLGQIDAVAGDGDHGRGMVKGVDAACAAAHQAVASKYGFTSVLTAAGNAWASKAGGTSGVLWGASLAAAGSAVADNANQVRAEDVLAAVRAFTTALTTLGKAQLGDKTMVDALVPFVDTLANGVEAGIGLTAAWQAAAAKATEAAEATAALRPRLGRARPLAERSIGTPDAGALSLAMCLQAIGQVIGT